MSDKPSQAEYHRRTIGVPSPFGLKELRADYLRLIKEHHPDRFFGNPQKYSAATEKTKQLNLSFQFLSEYLEDLGGTYTFIPSQTFKSEKRPSGVSRTEASYSPRYTYEGERYAEGFPDLSVIEIFLKSSHIISTGYNSDEQVLYIKFKGNRIYRYRNVPRSIVDAFLSAESHGKFAHRNIYHSFDYEPL